MSLVKISLSWLMLNVFIVLYLSLASSTTTTLTTSEIDYNTSGMSYSDLDNFDDKYMVSESVLDSAGIPEWFTNTFLLIDGLLFVFLLIGWIRGVA